MSAYKVGDWVKVTVTGKVEDVDEYGDEDGVLLEDWDYYFCGSDDRVAIEKITPPLPTTPDSVIRTATNGPSFYTLVTDGRWREGRTGFLLSPGFFYGSEYEVIFDAGKKS